jgi:hypothetical protein
MIVFLLKTSLVLAEASFPKALNKQFMIYSFRSVHSSQSHRVFLLLIKTLIVSPSTAYETFAVFLTVGKGFLSVTGTVRQKSQPKLQKRHATRFYYISLLIILFEVGFFLRLFAENHG